MLGYRVFKSTDNLHNKTVTTEYRQDFPFTGMMKSRTELHGISGEQSKTQTTYTYAKNALGRPYLLEQTTKAYDNSTLLSESFTSNLAIDDFGRPENINTVVSDKINNETYTSIVSSTYDKYDEFYGGRLSRLRTTQMRTGELSVVQITDFEYYSNTGLLWKKISDPTGNIGSSGSDETSQVYGVTEEYTRDDYGNITSTKITGIDEIERRIDVEFDSKGRYAEKSISYPKYPSLVDTIETSTAYDSIFGLKTSETSANGQVTRYGYTTLGRLNFVNKPDGTYSTTKKELCDGASDCPTSAFYKEINTNSHGPDSISYFDGLGQVVMEKSEALTCYDLLGKVSSCSGAEVSWIYKTYQYNNKGQLLFESRTHFEDDLSPIGYTGDLTTIVPEGYSSFIYDSQGRAKIQKRFDRSEWKTSYSGFTTTVTNPASNTTTNKVNALGELIEVTDADDKVVTYGYDAAGNLNLVKRSHTEISGGSGYIETTIEHDHLGRKVSMTDPDKGTMKYRYNSFGELVWQRDNKNQQTFTNYDAMGRSIEVKSYSDYDNNIVDSHSKYYYDEAANGLGLVHQEEDVINGIKQDYYYNVMSQTTSKITEFANGRKFYTDNVYDSLFRTKEVYDASHANAGVEYHYYNNYLVKKLDKQSGAILWQFLASDALGNATAFEYGNGIVSSSVHDQNDGTYEIILAVKGSDAVQDETYNFTNLGNLQYREDNIVGLREDFTYDSLNRLDTWKVNYGASFEDFNVDYDSLGNIKSKTGMGDYQYGQYHCGRQAGPHAVTTAGGFTYCYDANGNMTSGGNRSNILYNTIDKPTLIETGKNHRIEYQYGLGGSRFKRVDTEPGGTVKETLYIGNLEYISENGLLKKVLRHMEGTALETWTTQSGIRTLEFLHRDHLGSIVLITDIQGNVANRFSYDPWGDRRNESSFLEREFGSLDAALALSREDFKRGFTGHEHIDEAGLIHMGGRVYDQRLGRFLSADPFVQAAETLQSFNRYTYVFNNPLNATDPSGYIAALTVSGGMTMFNSGISSSAWNISNNFQLMNSYFVLIETYDNGYGENLLGWGETAVKTYQVYSLYRSAQVSHVVSTNRDKIESERLERYYMGEAIYGIVTYNPVADQMETQHAYNEGDIDLIDYLGESSRNTQGLLGMLYGGSGVSNIGKGSSGKGKQPKIDSHSSIKKNLVPPFPSNYTKRGTLTNRFPDDPSILQTTARKLVQDSSGRYWLQSTNGKRITPSGKYDFVTLPDGTIKVARQNTNPDFSTHLGLSKGGEVNYAGSITFSNNTTAKRGQINEWSNDSGHYAPPDYLSSKAGLPDTKFKPH